MKKIGFTISFLLLHVYFCAAQEKDNEQGSVENVKREYMSRELGLSPDEARKFWPMYNNYFNEVKMARKQFGNDEVAMDEKMVEIRKKYKNNFRSILSSDNRVNKVFVSEKNFRELVKKESLDRQRRKKYPAQKPPKQATRQKN